MKDKRVVVGGIFAAILAAIVYVVTRPSDESMIRAQMAKLAALVRVSDDDVQANPIARLAKVNDALEHLVDHDVRVSVPEVPQLGSGRAQLGQAITSEPRFVRTLDVDWKDVEVKLDEAHASALVGATAKVKAKELSNDTRDDERAVDLRFAKQSGEWIVTTITVWPQDEARPR